MQKQDWIDTGKMTHILDSNGLWLNDDSPSLDEKCLCGCTARKHLDGKSICLEINCICMNFVDENHRVIVTTSNSKKVIPKRNKQEEISIDNGQVVEKDKEYLSFVSQYAPV